MKIPTILALITLEEDQKTWSLKTLLLCLQQSDLQLRWDQEEEQKMTLQASIFKSSEPIMLWEQWWINLIMLPLNIESAFNTFAQL